MGIEQEALQNLSTLENLCVGSRATAVFNYAKKHGIADMRITCPKGIVHPATEYAIHISSSASFLLEDADDSFLEQIMIVSILVAMEDAGTSKWNPCSELLFNMTCEGVVLAKAEFAAFMAQYPIGDNQRTMDKLYNDKLATVIYCGRLLAICGSLPATFSIHAGADIPDDLTKEIDSCWADTPAASVEKIMRTFVPAFLGAGVEKPFATLAAGMRKYGFYTAPAAQTGPMACETGLVMYFTQLIYRHASLVKPQTHAHFGKLVLTDILHCMERAVLYKKEWTTKKVYCENGDIADPYGKKYKMLQTVGYYEDSSFPYGSGRTALYMAIRYFGNKLDRDIAIAIDTVPMGKEILPAHYYGHLVESPLCLTLHIADVLATNIDGPKMFGV